jgi:hypothetical protein
MARYPFRTQTTCECFSIALLMIINSTVVLQRRKTNASIHPGFIVDAVSWDESPSAIFFRHPAHGFGCWGDLEHSIANLQRISRGGYMRTIATQFPPIIVPME